MRRKHAQNGLDIIFNKYAWYSWRNTTEIVMLFVEHAIISPLIFPIFAQDSVNVP